LLNPHRSNGVESFFALLKRLNYGIQHHMNREYSGSYCAERDFAYNARKMSDDQRTDQALKGASGKGLMLKQPETSITPPPQAPTIGKVLIIKICLKYPCLQPD
jgi:hypothetical protein